MLVSIDNNRKYCLRHINVPSLLHFFLLFSSLFPSYNSVSPFFFSFTPSFEELPNRSWNQPTPPPPLGGWYRTVYTPVMPLVLCPHLMMICMMMMMERERKLRAQRTNSMYRLVVLTTLKHKDLSVESFLFSLMTHKIQKCFFNGSTTKVRITPPPPQSLSGSYFFMLLRVFSFLSGSEGLPPSYWYDQWPPNTLFYVHSLFYIISFTDALPKKIIYVVFSDFYTYLWMQTKYVFVSFFSYKYQ